MSIHCKNYTLRRPKKHPVLRVGRKLGSGVLINFATLVKSFAARYARRCSKHVDSYSFLACYNARYLSKNVNTDFSYDSLQQEIHKLYIIFDEEKTETNKTRI